MSNLLHLSSRAALSAIFIWSGASKLFALEGTADYIASAGAPFPELALWTAIFVELGAGLAFLFNVRAAQAAAVLAIFSLATAIMFHADFADENQLIHFMKNLSMAGGLALAAQASPWPRLSALLLPNYPVLKDR